MYERNFLICIVSPPGQGNQRGQDPRGAPLVCSASIGMWKKLEMQRQSKAKLRKEERWLHYAVLHGVKVKPTKSHSLTPTYTHTQQSRAQQVQLYSGHPTCAPCGQQLQRTTTLSRMAFLLNTPLLLLPGSSQGLLYKRARSLLNPELAREDEAQQYLIVSDNPSRINSRRFVLCSPPPKTYLLVACLPCLDLF